MRMLTNLEALKQKLDGIQATEEELKTIAAHILARENTLLKGVRCISPRISAIINVALERVFLSR
jgi:hypothetical protein